MNAFVPKDIVLFDRYYCSFMVIMAMANQGVDVCCRKHQLRRSDFRRGKRLGKYDHLISWQRPLQCPRWMDKETFASIPKTFTLRELKLSISQPGFRTQSIIVITTLTDIDEFSKEDIAELYGYRWNVELDIRSLKCNLNLDHVRCKSPEMVRCELWTTILAYNLIRSTAAIQGQPTDESWRRYCHWAQLLWSGDTKALLVKMKARKEVIGIPRDTEKETSPKQLLADAIRYVTNQQSRVKYDQHRRDGLPITSSYIESTIKQVNRRVKGTEKFWSTNADPILQLSADAISETNEMQKFWTSRAKTLPAFTHYKMTA